MTVLMAEPDHIVHLTAFGWRLLIISHFAHNRPLISLMKNEISALAAHSVNVQLRSAEYKQGIKQVDW